MLNTAYNISPLLLRYLSKIEQIRQRIILHPLSPKRELSLQFQATISRMVYRFGNMDKEIVYEEVKKTFSTTTEILTEKTGGPKKATDLQQQIWQYKQALDYLKTDWLVSERPIDAEALVKLHSLISKGKLRINKNQLQEVLDYLQFVGGAKIPLSGVTTASSPFIQAAIANLEFNALRPFTEGNKLFSMLSSYLFLYRAGLDCRGFLILEQAVGQNTQAYLEEYASGKGKANITGWLEYFVKAIGLQLEHAYTEATKSSQQIQPSLYDKITELNERQKEILNILDNPKSIITNRTVQKVFRISQITASRDLVHLAKLGLLFTHGKGRSVSYTRI